MDTISMITENISIIMDKKSTIMKIESKIVEKMTLILENTWDSLSRLAWKLIMKTTSDWFRYFSPGLSRVYRSPVLRTRSGIAHLGRPLPYLLPEV